MWDEPGSVHMLRCLACLGRLVTFDRRGCGLSSRTVKPTIEARVADLGDVLDAAEIELVLYSAVARTTVAPDYGLGLAPDVVDYVVSAAESTWGTGITALMDAPGLTGDTGFLEWAARYERASATPIEARHWAEMHMETDVRSVLPLVRAPSLVVTPTLAGGTAPSLSRYVAANLPRVRSVEISAHDQWPFGDGQAAFLHAISTFLTDIGGLEAPPPSRRRLAAVLFTDLVESTEHLRSMGDRKWAAILDSHDELADRAVARNRGRLIKSTGDGILAILEGPESAVAAAEEILDAARRIGLTARAGVHIGEVEERGDDVTGIAVNLASRITDCAGPNETIVSSTVRDLAAGSGLQLVPRGWRDLQGIDEPVELLAVSRSQDQHPGSERRQRPRPRHHARAGGAELRNHLAPALGAAGVANGWDTDVEQFPASVGPDVWFGGGGGRGGT